MGRLSHLPGLPPAAAGHIAGRLLNRHSPGEIAQAIDVLDCLGGDPDVEDDDPAEIDDPLEQDDPPEDDDSDHCEAGEDWMIGGAAVPTQSGGVGSSCRPNDEDFEMEQLADSFGEHDRREQEEGP
jgi:hypothetical protein